MLYTYQIEQWYDQFHNNKLSATTQHELPEFANANMAISYLEAAAFPGCVQRYARARDGSESRTSSGVVYQKRGGEPDYWLARYLTPWHEYGLVKKNNKFWHIRYTVGDRDYKTVFETLGHIRAGETARLFRERMLAEDIFVGMVLETIEIGGKKHNRFCSQDILILASLWDEHNDRTRLLLEFEIDGELLKETFVTDLDDVNKILGDFYGEKIAFAYRNRKPKERHTPNRRYTLGWEVPQETSRPLYF